jgi:hypothetical protein
VTSILVYARTPGHQKEVEDILRRRRYTLIPRKTIQTMPGSGQRPDIFIAEVQNVTHLDALLLFREVLLNPALIVMYPQDNEMLGAMAGISKADADITVPINPTQLLKVVEEVEKKL